MKIIIAGAGEVGFHIAERLSEEGHDVSLIDKDAQHVKRVSEGLDVQAFLGSGTTAAVARRMGRHWIGIEVDPDYARIAEERIAAVPEPNALRLEELRALEHRPPARVPFHELVERGLLKPGQELTEVKTGATAVVQDDGSLLAGDRRGSIHKIAAMLRGAPAANGWTCWQYRDEQTGELRLIDELRKRVRAAAGSDHDDA